MNRAALAFAFAAGLSLTSSPALAGPDSADGPTAAWELELQQAVALATRADPAAAATVDDLPVVTNRAGAPAIAQLDSDQLQPAEALVLLADRLYRRVDPPELRVAVAQAFVARGHELPTIIAGLYDDEADPAVRAVLVHGLRRVDATLALPRIRLAMADADAGLRLEAVVVAASHADAAVLAPELIAALGDNDAAVRGRAARALGRHGSSAAWAPLRARLADADPLVRLQSLRALQAIDPEASATLPELQTLAADPDSRVARAAASSMR